MCTTVLNKGCCALLYVAIDTKEAVPAVKGHKVQSVHIQLKKLVVLKSVVRVYHRLDQRRLCSSTVQYFKRLLIPRRLF